MGNINIVSPAEACIVSGGWCGSKNRKYKVHGWLWSWWGVSNVERLCLNVMTLKPRCAGVETSKGVPLTVEGVAQVKVMYQKGQKQILDRACEAFIGKTNEEIKEILQLTLEGHLRAITGQMTVEQIYTDRDEFSELVRETATPDLGKMGIQILSFVLQDIRDNVQYLTSIGRTQAAVVIKEATIGTNNAKRDAKIIESQCEKEKSEVINKCQENIDTARKNFKTMEAECNTQIYAAKTEAGLAYDLQKAKEEQVIREKEIEVEIIKAKTQIEVEKAEILRRERELEATERLPAVFEAKKVALLAEGNKMAKITVAEGNAIRIRLIGKAESDAIRAIGEATAEAMKTRAVAMQDYGREALVQMILESLPSLAAEISAPLNKIDEIVIMGSDGNSTSTQLSKVMAEVPVVTEALMGVDLKKVVKNHSKKH